MQLHPDEVHIWSTSLVVSEHQEIALREILSRDEIKRIDQIRNPIIRRRLTASRGILRHILSQYLNIRPNHIQFFYNEHKKPSLQTPSSSAIQFNLSHSDEMALYGLTLSHDIGVDIEKIKPIHALALAKRYFHEEEANALFLLKDKAQTAAFYRLWSRKEALIKAVGLGLALPLCSFKVSIDLLSETIMLPNSSWALLTLDIHPDYASALATNQDIKTLQYYTFNNSL